jgi:hypothetical protein
MENEQRLIDANAVDYENIMGSLSQLQWLNAIIEAQPTVDAVEVVHGEWGEIYTCHGERLWGYRCSQCEADNSEKSNYCPNCGAKMDGGKDNEC